MDLTEKNNPNRTIKMDLSYYNLPREVNTQKIYVNLLPFRLLPVLVEFLICLFGNCVLDN